MKAIQTEITNILFDKGASLIGYANLDEIGTHYKDLPYAISIAVALDKEIVKNNIDGPTTEYYNEYKRAMNQLKELGLCADNILKENGHKAVILDPSGDIDLEKLTTPIPHKLIAVKSGMGWIGKNGVLVTNEFGPAVMLVSVLTDAVFEVNSPIEKSSCGSCSVCVNACPANAMKGKLWTAGVEREALLDAFVCEKVADERGKKIGIDPSETVCGICISVCPKCNN